MKKHWRLPVLVSAMVHGVMALLVWLAPAIDSSAPVGWSPSPIHDREIDVQVMDILEPVEEARPGIVQHAPIPGTPAPLPSVDPPATALAPSAAGVKPDGLQLASASRPGDGSPPLQLEAAPVAGGPLFPVHDTAKSVVYVIDRSGSMGERGQLALARRELEASLYRLPEWTRFQVIAYNRRAEALRLGGRTDLVAATLENVSQASRLLRDLVPEGGTGHFAALRQALVLQPDVIFFLTDADDLNPADVQSLTQLNGGRSAIHVVELTVSNRGRHEMPMQRLARGNRGGYRAVDVKP